MKKLVLLSKLFDPGMELLCGQLEIIEAITDHPEEKLELLKEADAILLGNQQFGRDMMERLPGLKLLAKQGSGYDNIDIQAATRRGIPVVLSAGANAGAVAEHVMMMVLAANKNLYYYDNAVRNGHFQVRSSCQSRTVEESVIGLVGCGSIGRMVGRYAQGMRMDVRVYDPYMNHKEAEELGFTVCNSLNELLEQSDTISIHVPLNDQTSNMIGSQQIARMKDGSVLVNCSRGGVVDEDALYQALKSKKLLAAGIDVYENEPAPQHHPLFSLDNVIVTPHSAALTKEAASIMSTMTAQGILDVLHHIPCQKAANPQVFDTDQWHSSLKHDTKGED